MKLINRKAHMDAILIKPRMLGNLLGMKLGLMALFFLSCTGSQKQPESPHKSTASVIDDDGPTRKIASAETIEGIPRGSRTATPRQSKPRGARSPSRTAKQKEKTRISVDARNVDVRRLIRQIAEQAGVNIVVADDVSGSVTLQLRNIPWTDALEAVVQSSGLGLESSPPGNYRVYKTK